MTAKTTPDSSRAVVAQTQSPLLPGPGHHYPCPLGTLPVLLRPHTATPCVCPTWVPPSLVPAVLFLPSPLLCIAALWMPSGLSAQAVWLMCMLYPAPPFLLRDPGQGTKLGFPVYLMGMLIIPTTAGAERRARGVRGAPGRSSSHQASRSPRAGRVPSVCSTTVALAPVGTGSGPLGRLYFFEERMNRILRTGPWAGRQGP